MDTVSTPQNPDKIEVQKNRPYYLYIPKLHNTFTFQGLKTFVLLEFIISMYISDRIWQWVRKLAARADSNSGTYIWFAKPAPLSILELSTYWKSLDPVVILGRRYRYRLSL